MKSVFLRLVFIVALAHAVLAAPAADAAAARPDDETLSEAFARVCTDHQAPAAALVASIRGVSTIHTCGRTRIGKPVTEDSVFRVASVTKVFTALTVADLVLADELSLDGDLRERFAWLERHAPDQPVTLRGVLTHTTGFDDRVTGMLATNEIEPLGAYLSEALPARTTAPGRWTRYSNHAFALAGLAIEHATGRPFEQAVAASVFEPAAMTSSSVREPIPEALLAALVRAYPCADAACDPFPLTYRHTGPSGAMVSSAADMQRFMTRAFDPATSIGAALRYAARPYWQPHTDLPGMGLALHEQTIGTTTAYVHAGGSSGYRSLLALLPDASSGVFLVTNGGASAAGRDVLAAFETFFATGRSVAIEPLPAGAGDAVAGSYQSARAPRASAESFPARFLFSETVAVDADGFLVRQEGGQVRRYGQSGEPSDVLVSADGKGRMLIDRDASGRIVGLFAAEEFFGIRFPASYSRLAFWEAPGFLNELLSWLIAIPALALIAWLLVEGWRAFRQRRFRALRELPWVTVSMSLALATILITFALGFMARFNALAARAPERLAVGLPDELAALLWMPWAIVALQITLIVAWVTTRARHRYRTDHGAVGFVLVAALAFTALLVDFRLLPASF